MLGGLGIAQGLKALFDAAGFALPAGDWRSPGPRSCSRCWSASA
ncbi:hypothetical protein ACFQ9X_02275 [Catenulispora yoronensis]